MNPTGSSAGRAAACAASHVLPRAESQGDAAKDGNEIHNYLARVAVSPATKSVALREVAAHLQARCAAIDVAGALDGLRGITAEAAYAYDVATEKVRHLGVNIGRKYGDLAPTEVALTLDVLALGVGGRPVALDWKTGQDVGEVSENWQMRIQALVTRAAIGADEVEARIAYVDEDGGTRTAVHVFDAFALDAAAEELRDVLGRVRDAERAVAESRVPALNEGDHCKYCPSFSFCPAKTSLARSMVRDVEALTGTVEAMTPDEQGAVWAKLKAFFAVARKVEDVIKDAARRGDVPLPNGKVLREVRASRDTVDGKRALVMLRELGADATLLSTLTTTTEYGVIKECKP